jgi:hypothetical protein
MLMKAYQQTALAIAMCALAGAAVAQSSSPSTSSPNSGSSSTATQGTTGSRVNQGSQGSTGTGMSQGSGTSGTSGMAQGSSTTRMPSRTDSADSAYKSLDSSNRGYLSKSDVQGISGFNFDQADINHDGRLTKDEFSKAWGQSK